MFKKFFSIFFIVVVITATLVAVGCGGGGGGGSASSGGNNAIDNGNNGSGINGPQVSLLKKLTVNIPATMLTSAVSSSVRASVFNSSSEMNVKVAAYSKSTIIGQAPGYENGEVQYIKVNYNEATGNFTGSSLVKTIYDYKTTIVGTPTDDAIELQANVISSSQLSNNIDSVVIDQTTSYKVVVYEKWSIVSNTDDKSLDNFKLSCVADGLKTNATANEEFEYYKTKCDYETLSKYYEEVAKVEFQAVSGGYTWNNDSVHISLGGSITDLADVDDIKVQTYVILKVGENTDNIIVDNLYRVNGVNFDITKISVQYSLTKEECDLIKSKIRIAKKSKNSSNYSIKTLGDYGDSIKWTVYEKYLEGGQNQGTTYQHSGQTGTVTINTGEGNAIINTGGVSINKGTFPVIKIEFTNSLDYDTEYSIFIAENDSSNNEWKDNIVTDRIEIEPFAKFSFTTVSAPKNTVTITAVQPTGGIQDGIKFTASPYTFTEDQKKEIEDAISVSSENGSIKAETEGFKVDWQDDSSFVLDFNFNFIDSNKILLADKYYYKVNTSYTISMLEMLDQSTDTSILFEDYTFTIDTVTFTGEAEVETSGINLPNSSNSKTYIITFNSYFPRHTFTESQLTGIADSIVISSDKGIVDKNAYTVKFQGENEISVLETESGLNIVISDSGNGKFDSDTKYFVTMNKEFEGITVVVDCSFTTPENFNN